MLEWYPGEDEKTQIVAELTCAGICPKGIEMFYRLYGQYSSLDAHDWMFRSGFMKDGQITDDCVIMQFGDGYTKDRSKAPKLAEVALQRYFGLFARKAMFDSIVLLTSSLSTGDEECESSLLNFAEKHCPEAISKRIKHEISKESLKKIDGAKDLHLYRNKRAAHHDYGLDTDKIRLLYGAIEECIDRIFRVMNVVYPMPPRVDWRKREDIISRHRKPTQWTTDPGEPFIVQFLKELAIRRRRGNLQLLEPSVENSKVALMRDEILAEIEKIRAS